MATSLREQVVDAVHDVLAAMAAGSPTLVDGLAVERIRARPLTPAAMPRLVVLDGRQELDVETAAAKVYEVAVRVLGFVKAAADSAVGTALNELYAQAVKALEADKTLGLSFVTWSGEGDLETEFDDEEGHAPTAAFELTWRVRYQTAAADPYSAPG